MQCEMCGSEGLIVRAVVEGSEMDLCTRCAKFGRIINRPATRPTNKAVNKPRAVPSVELMQVIVGSYGRLIKDKRESLGLKQEELARIMSEKESVIHKTESEKIEPSISLARKFEKFLKIKLVEQHEEEHKKIAGTGGRGLTVGDLLNLKK